MSKKRKGQLTEKEIVELMMKVNEHPIAHETSNLELAASLIYKQDDVCTTKSRLAKLMQVANNEALRYLNFFVDVEMASKKRYTYTFDKAKLSSFIKNMKAGETI